MPNTAGTPIPLLDHKSIATKHVTTSNTCPQCGAALPQSHLHGLCPRCVARQAAGIHDRSGYLQLRSQIESRFGATADPTVADRMAKACLIYPAQGSDLATESRLAELAVTVGKDDLYASWFALCKGLAEYRLDHFDSVSEWMEKVLNEANHIAARDTAAYLILAMARQK